MLKRTSYLSHSYDKPDSFTLASYEANGGYQGARKALGMPREKVVDEAKAAHIRGRGGAGFDCGLKWSFMPKESKKPHYLVVNADEGEPGTFKDRTIMERNPHSLVEGCIIGAYGIGAHAAYIYVRDELHLSKQRLWDAIAEAKASVLAADPDPTPGLVQESQRFDRLLGDPEAIRRMERFLELGGQTRDVELDLAGLYDQL